MDPMKLEDDGAILIPDDSSMASQEMLAQTDEIEYDLKGDNGVVAYRVVQIPESKLPPLAPAPPPQPNATGVTAQHCQFYLISSNDLVTQTAVTPKLQRQIGPIVKKRNDQRRATHNEVERRRRDKINYWITKLGSIMPENTTQSIDDTIASAGTTTTATTINSKMGSSENNSKSNILSKACEYIPMLQEHIGSLKECLKDSEKITTENQKLRECNSRLRIENERLKLLLKKVGVKIDTTLKDGSDSS